MNKNYSVALFMLAAGIVALIPTQTTPMPGFARRYNMSCQVCHAPFPKLKPYAFDFIGEGYRLPEGEPPRATMNTGDDLLTLNRDIPLGLRMDLYGTYDHDGEPNNDLKTPWLLKILSGGPLAEDISYYFYFFFSEAGEIAGIEDALLYFRDLFGSGINLTVGQFAVNDPLYKSETRLTKEKYVLYQRRPGQSVGNLTYDRGVVLDTGFDFGLDLVAMVLNGNGIGTAGNAFDVDSYKTGFFRAAQGLGPVSLGGFFYYGVEEGRREVAVVAEGQDEGTDGPSLETNKIMYAGGDLSLQFEEFELNGLYLMRKDSDPLFMGDGPDVTSHGLMVEAIWRPGYDQGRFALVGLYNWFASDFEDINGDDPLAYHSATLSGSWLLGRNARLVGEYTWLIQDGEKENGHKATVGLVTAF